MDFQTTKDNLRASASKQKKLMPLIDTQRKQEQKARDAAEYRARILQKQRKENGELSPSFQREKAAIKASKKGKDNRDHRQRSVDGKATTAQCAFNLANILMVSQSSDCNNSKILRMKLALTCSQTTNRALDFWVYLMLVQKQEFLAALLPLFRSDLCVGRHQYLSVEN